MECCSAVELSGFTLRDDVEAKRAWGPTMGSTALASVRTDSMLRRERLEGERSDAKDGTAFKESRLSAVRSLLPLDPPRPLRQYQRRRGSPGPLSAIECAPPKQLRLSPFSLPPPSCSVPSHPGVVEISVKWEERETRCRTGVSEPLLLSGSWREVEWVGR